MLGIGLVLGLAMVYRLAHFTFVTLTARRSPQTRILPIANHAPVFRQPLENGQSGFNCVYSAELSCSVSDADLATELVEFEREFLHVVHSTPTVAVHRHAAGAAVVFSAGHFDDGHLRRVCHACVTAICRR